MMMMMKESESLFLPSQHCYRSKEFDPIALTFACHPPQFRWKSTTRVEIAGLQNLWYKQQRHGCAWASKCFCSWTDADTLLWPCAGIAPTSLVVRIAIPGWSRIASATNCSAINAVTQNACRPPAPNAVRTTSWQSVGLASNDWPKKRWLCFPERA